MPQQRRKITVTQDLIDKATTNDSRHCMVADAMKAAIPDASNIIVDLNTIRLTMRNGNRWAYITPGRVGDYIIAFDAGDPIQPFTFVLDDQMRVAIKRQVPTPAGKAQRAATKAKRDAAKRLAELQADPDVTPARVEVAKEEVALAEQRVAETTAKVAESGRPVREREPNLPPDAETGLPQMRSRAPRRTHGDRIYGRRVLRQNQDREDSPLGPRGGSRAGG